MKILMILLSFTFITMTLYAEIKWIPIEPIEPIKPITYNENTKAENNISAIKPKNQLFENVKVIQQLLDNTKDNEEDEKDWYPLQEREKN